MEMHNFAPFKSMNASADPIYDQVQSFHEGFVFKKEESVHSIIFLLLILELSLIILGLLGYLIISL